MRSIRFLAMLALAPAALAGNIGAFTQASDVGTVKQPVTAAYDSLSGTYTLGASGANIWDTQDAFGYLWKQVHGDFTIGATVNLKGKGGHAHRKAGLMLRQSLEPGSPYVDIVVHGDGLTSLQYRSEPGGPTREIQCATESPYGMRLEKRGDYIQVGLANDAGLFSASGCGIRIALRGTYYAGLVVCAHDDAAFETAEFKHVGTGMPAEKTEERLSAIEILTVGTLQRRIAYISRTPTDSPSFTADGEAICFRSEGQLLRLALDATSDAEIIGLPNADHCSIAAASGPPALRLTHEVKGGHAQIWRATAGGAQSQVTKDKLQNWQPRLAPSGESFVYLSGSAPPDGGRIAPGDYLLREMPAMGGTPRELATFFGGPGSLGPAPWSPDGTRIVFISREPD